MFAPSVTNLFAVITLKKLAVSSIAFGKVVGVQFPFAFQFPLALRFHVEEIAKIELEKRQAIGKRQSFLILIIRHLFLTF